MALTAACLTTVVLGCVYGLSIARMPADAVVYHDSLNYLRDALMLQHHVFDEPQQVIEDWYVQAAGRDPGELIMRFPRSIGWSSQIAVLMQLTGGEHRVVFWINLIFFTGACGLLSYITAREIGLVGGLLVAPALLLIYDGLQIATLMIEPMFAVWLVAMAALIRAALRGYRWSLPLSWLLVPFMVLYKASLAPFGLLTLVTVGAAVGWRLSERRRWRGGRALWAGSFALCSVVPVVLVPATIGSVLTSSGIVSQEKVDRSNSGYALWMGSLHSDWAGCYSGRLDAASFKAMRSPAVLEQVRDYWNVYTYFMPTGVALAVVWQNTLHHPLDRLKTFSFRYAQMTGIHPARWGSVAVALSGLGVAGAAWILLSRWAGMVPFVVFSQGMAWIHALSRLRDRDFDQIAPLLAMIIAWTIGLFVSSLLQRRWASPAGRLPRWAAYPFALAVALPVLALAVVPEVLSDDPPAGEVTMQVLDDPQPRLRVDAAMEEPFLFTRFYSRSTGYVYRQTDEKGRVSFTVPLAELGPLAEEKPRLQAWSKTQVRRTWLPDEELLDDAPANR